MSEDRKEVVVCGDGEGLHHEVFVGSHRQAADEPPESGGSDRESRAEEEAMAARISENWDRFLDLTLREQGLLPHSS